MTSLLRLLWRLLNIIDFLVLTLVAYLASFVAGKGRPWYRRLFRCWCRHFARALGTRVHVIQHYGASLPAHYILIANHPSAFEDIGIPAFFPVTSLAKIEVGDWLIFGRISTAAGTLYVRREERESRHAALDNMIDTIRAGNNLAIYPEGGCHGRRLHTRFLRGAFAASQATGVPVLPVYIEYEAADSFEWQGQTLVRKIVEVATAPNPRVNLHVYPALQPQDFEDEQAMRDAAYALYQQWDERFFGPLPGGSSEHVDERTRGKATGAQNAGPVLRSATD